MKYSTWGVTFNLLGQCIFIGIYVWAVLSESAAVPWWAEILAGLVVLVFVFGGLQNVFQLISGRPAVVMDREGLQINSAEFVSYRIPWDDIASITKKKKLLQPYVAIHVKTHIVFQHHPWY